ncbi:MAG: hypothetical protein ACI9GH_000150 [Candidatus Paceibacteria bacterium]
MGFLRELIFLVGVFAIPEYEGYYNKNYDYDTELVFEELVNISNIPRDRY